MCFHVTIFFFKGVDQCSPFVFVCVARVKVWTKLIVSCGCKCGESCSKTLIVSCLCMRPYFLHVVVSVVRVVLN